MLNPECGASQPPPPICRNDRISVEIGHFRGLARRPHQIALEPRSLVRVNDAIIIRELQAQ
jgi:hypothetical protein